MTGQDVIARLDHMIDAIDMIFLIEQTGSNLKPALAKLATERAFEILSEASRHVPDSIKATEPDIAWRQIAGIGNILRHDYQAVSEAVLNNATTEHLPGLKAALLRLKIVLEKS